VTTVQRWSGLEVRALREAKRMSLRDFAAHLGVSERMISKWEAGRDAIHPRSVNQAALDTVLARCDPDTRARFVHLAGESLVPAAVDAQPEIIGANQIRHPVDGSPMVLVEGAIFLSGRSNDPVWLPSFFIDVHPVSNADYARFVAATDRTCSQHWIDGQYPKRLADHPVVFVTWNDATAYAAWAGKTLPSSQEWEKAARGTPRQRLPVGRPADAGEVQRSRERRRRDHRRRLLPERRQPVRRLRHVRQRLGVVLH
jgi:formylglycine-generating enzyme required for sulfatase activity